MVSGPGTVQSAGHKRAGIHRIPGIFRSAIVIREDVYLRPAFDENRLECRNRSDRLSESTMKAR